MSRHARSLGSILASIAVVLATSVAPSLASSPEPTVTFADVPTNRGNPTRDGVQPGPAPDGKPSTVWTFQTGDEIHFTPIVAEGMVFVGSWDKNLYALDAATGAERWRLAAAGAVDSATYADGTLYTADDSGTFRALYAASGTERWHADVSANTLSPSVSDGVVYLGTTDGRLLGLGVTSGEVRTTFQAPAAVLRTTVADGVAYFGAEDGVIYAVRTSDGSELWHLRTLSTTVSTIIVEGGVVYAAGIQNAGEPMGELYAIDAATGTVTWRFRSPSGRSILPGILMANVLYAPTDDGFYALDAATGQIVWHIDVPFGFMTAATDDGELYYQIDDALITLSTSDGRELWRVNIAPGSNNGAAVTGGFAFVGDIAGTLHAFGSASLAVAPTPVPSLAPTALPSGGTSALELAITLDASSIEGLNGPGGMDVGPDDLLYLPNLHSSEILVVDAAGLVVRRWGTHGTGEGEFDFSRTPGDPNNDIGGVAVAPDGTVYVADTANHRVQAFDADGTFLGAWGSYGSGDGQFLEPFDLDVGPDGSVYVVDDIRDDIQQFTGDGAYMRTIGRHGTGDGELNFTGGIVVGPDGTIVNADFDNNRVQAWDSNGAFLWTVGTRTPGAPVRFDHPAGIALDEHGNLYVTDDATGLQVFDPRWNLIAVSDLHGDPVVDAEGHVWLGNGWENSITQLRLAD